MTAKQTRILNVASTLFANHGVDGVSTARIAREAEVSEGLIFRHFRNKQGLVDAILQAGSTAEDERLAKIASMPEAGAQIEALIRLAFAKPKGEDHHRKLRAHLSAVGQQPASDDGQRRDLLVKAFRKLGYEDPSLEASFLHHALAGIEQAVQSGSVRQAKKLLGFVLAMYT